MDWSVLFTNIITLVVASITGFYIFSRDMKQELKNDIKELADKLQRDLESFETHFDKRTGESDKKFYDLLKEMHRIDKDVHSLKPKK